MSLMQDLLIIGNFTPRLVWLFAIVQSAHDLLPACPTDIKMCVQAWMYVYTVNYGVHFPLMLCTYV